MAGLGEVCSHVAAVLFKIEACVRLGLNSVSCTSIPCQWNQNFTKKVKAVQLAEISFRKPKQRNYHIASPPHITHRRPVFDGASSFLEKLESSYPSAVTFTVTNPKPNPPISRPTLPALMSSLYNESNRMLSSDELLSKCNDTMNSLSLTSDEMANLEKATRGQSSSLKWFDYRRGRLTASCFHDICHTNIDNPSLSLLDKIMQYTIPIETKATKWGKEKESLALRDYEQFMTNHNSSHKVSASGLVINPDFPYLGASPDGISECACCGRGVVEIKCTFKHRDVQPCVVSSKDFYLNSHNCRLDVNGNTTMFCVNSLKKKSKHYSQVQGQIAICDVEFCDFVCWTPKGIHVERVYRD